LTNFLMQLPEARTLLEPAGWHDTTPARWADLGCGTGLFTEAIARLLPPMSTIYAVDTDRAALEQVPAVTERFVEKANLDFSRDAWPFTDIDGILMANSLHYVRDKRAFLEKATGHLSVRGRFLIVEYDTTVANPWVPYPLPFTELIRLFAAAGYPAARRLAEQPSRFRNGNLYAALIEKQERG